MQSSTGHPEDSGNQSRSAPTLKGPSAPGGWLRPVQPADAEQIHQLLLSILPDVPPDRARWLARWRWQYWNNPYRLNRPAGWVLEGGGKIVGHLGAVHVPLRMGQERGTGIIGADYAVSAEALRHGGAFAGLQLAQALFQESGDHIVLATTANEQTGAIFGRFGCRPVEWTREFWRAPATMAQLLRTGYGSSNRLARRLLSGFPGSLVADVLGRGCTLLRYQPTLPLQPGYRIEMTLPCSPCPFGMLYEQLVAGHGAVPATPIALGQWPAHFGIDRSQDYLDWRYIHHPERESIRVISVSDRAGQLYGSAIVFLDIHAPRRVACVEEIIARPDRTDVWRMLFLAALRLAWAHDMEYLVTTTGRRGLRGFFWELGFQSRARNAPAALVLQSPQCRPSQSLREPLADHYEFWHGEMF